MVELRKKEITTLRGELESRRDELQARLGEDMESVRSGEAGDTRGGSDRGDESVSTVEQEFRLKRAESGNRELVEINAALARMDAGEYGICVDCDEPIGAARLKAVPAVARCIRCQERYEDDRSERDATPSL